MATTTDQERATLARFVAQEKQKDLQAVRSALADLQAIKGRLAKRGMYDIVDMLHTPALALVGKRHDLTNEVKEAEESASYWEHYARISAEDK